MRKLLSAGIYRIFRHPLILAVLLVLSAACGVLCGADLRYGLDDIFLMPMLFAFGAMIALSWGREYGDGAIRNKVVAGCTKGQIFLAETLLHAATCAVMVLCFMLAMMIAGHDVIARMPAAVTFEICLCLLLSALSMGVLLSAVCALISNRAVSAVVGILLVLGLMFASYQLQDMLNQPSTITVEHMDENNELVRIEEVENRFYIGGPLRPICEGLDRVAPFGQMSRAMSTLSGYAYYGGEDYDRDPEWIAEKEARVKELHALPLYAVAFCAAVTAAGYALFRRKDLK